MITLWAAFGRSRTLPDPEAEGGRGLFLVESLSTTLGVHWPENATGKVVWSVITAPDEQDRDSQRNRQRSQVSLPKRVPALYSLAWPAQAMNDVAVLQRVREGLKGLE